MVELVGFVILLVVVADAVQGQITMVSNVAN